MKAADVTVGEEYVACTQDPLAKSTYADRYRIKILEVGVRGWARRYSWGSTYPIKGKVAANGPRDHVLALQFDRDWEKERKEHEAAVRDYLADNPPPKGLVERDLERYAAKVSNAVKTPKRYKAKGKEVRVRLRDIRLPWAAYESAKEQQEALELERKEESDQARERAEKLNARMAADGINLQVGTEWIGQRTAWRIRTADYINDPEGLMDTLEGLL